MLSEVDRFSNRLGDWFSVRSVQLSRTRFNVQFTLYKYKKNCRSFKKANQNSVVKKHTHSIHTGLNTIRYENRFFSWIKPNGSPLPDRTTSPVRSDKTAHLKTRCKVQPRVSLSWEFSTSSTNSGVILFSGLLLLKYIYTAVMISWGHEDELDDKLIFYPANVPTYMFFFFFFAVIGQTNYERWRALKIANLFS